MKWTKGVWIFLALVLLCFLMIPLHTGVFRMQVPAHLSEILFQNFTTKYNKSYSSPEEFQKRLGIFKRNLEEIVLLNNAPDAAAHFAVNRYSDLTTDEFKMLHLNKKISQAVQARIKVVQSKPKKNTTSSVDQNGLKFEFTDNNEYERHPTFYSTELLEQNMNFIPPKVDWRKKNVLSPVEFQGECEACYAFTVVEMIEANLAIHKNMTKRISVQQMIDCSVGNEGCNGGDVCLLLDWLTRNQIKIHTKQDYPRSEDGMNQTCIEFLDDPSKEVFHAVEYTCTSFIENERVIPEIIANYGPVVAAVDAVPWRNFESGIIQHECDSSNEVNHAVLIVGYDLTGTKPHYIVQNTWGDQFAEQGFVRVAFGNNTCGIATQISLVKL